MSEESKSEAEVSQETQEQSASTVDENATVTVDGETLRVGDLLQARKKLAEAEEYQKHARVLINNTDGVLTPERERAIRYLMTQEGWEPGDVDQYVEYIRQATDENESEEQNVDPTQRTKPQEVQEERELSPQEQELQEMRARLQELEQRHVQTEQQTGQERVEKVRRDLNEALDSVLDQPRELGVLLKRMNELDPEENRDQTRQSRMEIIRQDLNRETIGILQKWKRSGRDLTFESIREAARAAEGEVAKRYRTVIGDPNRIGRVSETVAGEVGIRKPPKATAPEIKPGESMADILEKAKGYTAGTLEELAWESTHGGETSF